MPRTLRRCSESAARHAIPRSKQIPSKYQTSRRRTPPGGTDGHPIGATHGPADFHGPDTESAVGHIFKINSARLLCECSQNKEPQNCFSDSIQGNLSRNRFSESIPRSLFHPGLASFDQRCRIRQCIVEGPRWMPETWESYKKEHAVSGPAQHLAFAMCYWRRTHGTLVVGLHPNTPGSELSRRCTRPPLHPSRRQASCWRQRVPGPRRFAGRDGLGEHPGEDSGLCHFEGNGGYKTDRLCCSRAIAGTPLYIKRGASPPLRLRRNPSR